MTLTTLVTEFFVVSTWWVLTMSNCTVSISHVCFEDKTRGLLCIFIFTPLLRISLMMLSNIFLYLIVPGNFFNKFIILGNFWSMVQDKTSWRFFFVFVFSFKHCMDQHCSIQSPFYEIVIVLPGCALKPEQKWYVVVHRSTTNLESKCTMWTI